MALLARALALLWAGFWLFFFAVEAWVWRTPSRVLSFWCCVGLLFMVLALLPWRWEMTGGVALLVMGLLIGMAYAIWSPPRLPVSSVVITTTVLSGPPLLAGILLLLHQRSMSART